MAAGLRLSVIVPVGPGERAWRSLLGDLDALAGEAEVLLVAAGSDASARFVDPGQPPAVACRWLQSTAGRARQQNTGAAAATGATLWFLHADSRVSAATLTAALRFAGDPGLGYFDLRFLDDGPWLVKLNAIGVRFRSRLLGLPFGDQGLILSRSLFRQLGGFDERLPGGEDHALVWAARRAGLRIVPLSAIIETSARRYAEQGWLRTTLCHLWRTIAQAREFAAASRRK